MKLSHQNHNFNQQINSNTLNKQKHFLTKLDNQIFFMQEAIKIYNESDKNSHAWKKLFSMPVNSCQLKTLTQPKLQHILLKSNFIKAKQNKSPSNHSFLRNSIKKGQQRTKQDSSISKQFKVSQTTSINFDNNQQKLRNKTLINNESTKSVFQPNFFNPQHQIDPQLLNQFQFLPITEAIKIPSKSHYETVNIRRKISQRTQRLQKEWMKTQTFREKFNITSRNMQTQILTSRASKRGERRLTSIIERIQHRRPSTSVSGWRQNFINTNNKKLNNLLDQFTRQKQTSSIKQIDY